MICHRIFRSLELSRCVLRTFPFQTYLEAWWRLWRLEIKFLHDNFLNGLQPTSHLDVECCFDQPNVKLYVYFVVFFVGNEFFRETFPVRFFVSIVYRKNCCRRSVVNAVGGLENLRHQLYWLYQNILTVRIHLEFKIDPPHSHESSINMATLWGNWPGLERMPRVMRLERVFFKFASYLGTSFFKAGWSCGDSQILLMFLKSIESACGIKTQVKRLNTTVNFMVLQTTVNHTWNKYIYFELLTLVSYLNLNKINHLKWLEID